MQRRKQSITLVDDNHRKPVDINNVSRNMIKSMFVLLETGRINPYELIVTYSYLFNGMSLNQLRDRCLKQVDGVYAFPSKQTLHQNIILKVTDLMNAEVDRMNEIEQKNIYHYRQRKTGDE